MCRDHIPIFKFRQKRLIFNQEGLRVAVVNDNEIHFPAVKVFRDLGSSVELESGLNGQERVVLNPPTNIHEGQKIKVAPPSDNDGQKVASADRDTAADQTLPTNPRNKTSGQDKIIHHPLAAAGV
jgi:HlyD family secretion protein